MWGECFKITVTATGWETTLRMCTEHKQFSRSTRKERPKESSQHCGTGTMAGGGGSEVLCWGGRTITKCRIRSNNTMSILRRQSGPVVLGHAFFVSHFNQLVPGSACSTLSSRKDWTECLLRWMSKEWIEWFIWWIRIKSTLDSALGGVGNQRRFGKFLRLVCQT